MWLPLRGAVAGALATAGIAPVRNVLAHPERLGLCREEGFDCLGYGLLGLAVLPFAAWLVCWLFLRLLLVRQAALVATLGGTCAFLFLLAASSAGLVIRPALGAPVLALCCAGATVVTREGPASGR
jgi:hypothetical protein